MPSTSRGYPYPSGSDDVDIPGDIQALADAVNTDVGTIATTTPSAPVLQTLADAAGDLAVGSAADTFGKLALGTDNYALTVNTAGSGVAKVGWEDPTANPLTTAAMALKVNTATVGNLLTANQASIETDTTGFNNPDGCALARSTTAGTFLVGAASLAATCSSTTFSFFTPLGASGVPVTPGLTYHAQVSAKAGTNPANLYVAIRFYNGAASLGDSAGSDMAVTTSAWATLRATFVAPATATHATVFVASGSGGVTASDVYYFDEFGFWQGAGGQWALPGTPITNLGFYTDESVGRRLFQWDANNSRWQQTYSDTGVRDMTGLTLTDGWALSTSNYFTLRRVGNVVSLGTELTGASVTGTNITTIPAGFRPSFGGWSFAFAIGASSTARLCEVTVAGAMVVFDYTTSAQHRIHSTWITNDAWPTTLPGTASGAIPA